MKTLLKANRLRAFARSLIVLAVVALGGHRMQAQQPSAGTPASEDKVAGAFYCNMSALDAAERRSHEQLTKKLISERTQIVETEKGYEFQFDPAVVPIAELATWAVAESKCCPFFDFHIDLENRGTLACLRLTGAPGIKPFIREEFRVPSK